MKRRPKVISPEEILAYLTAHPGSSYSEITYGISSGLAHPIRGTLKMMEKQGQIEADYTGRQKYYYLAGTMHQGHALDSIWAPRPAEDMPGRVYKWMK